MILSALLMAAQAAAPASLPSGEPVPEIVVIGNLRSVQVRVGQDQEDKWHCSMNKSTGRPGLDHSFCKAVTKCVRKGASDQAAIDSCIRDTRGRLVRKVERTMKKKNSK